MIDIIDNHLVYLKQSINWIATHLEGERKRKAYDYLVKCRRKLNRIKFALEENPATVMFGESQQGKSYLVSSLLSTVDKPFTVLDEKKKKKYDFITEINPTGQGAESTSLVTRFSINSSSPFGDYPVKLKLLTVSDIILVLCDTYYNDLKEHNYISVDEIQRKLTNFSSKYQNTEGVQKYLGEDDILDIEDYFDKYFVSKAPYIKDSDFFYIVSQFISKVESAGWCDIFSILWNENPHLTTLFKKFINSFSQINFTKEVFVSYDAILREKGTLLDVTRLYELYSSNEFEQNYVAEVVLKYYDTDGAEMQKSIKKSILCALASEVILRLPEDIVQDKIFLNKTDILDFPGVRARLELKENADDLDQMIPQMLLRGKVAYFFNKYTDSFKINTLMFCHGKNQAGPRFMPQLLENWIQSFIGNTQDKRQSFLNDAQISPLFVIGTMFNKDLQKEQNDRLGSIDSLNYRWEQRYERVYKKEMFGEINSWFESWTTNTPNFANIYLLRDYYYSSEGQSNIYRGWTRQGGKELDEIIPIDYTSFRSDLKKSFLEHEFVKKHFANPEISWDEAATINKDGSDLIIKNLTIAAQNINVAREGKFLRELVGIANDIATELDRYYHSENSDDNLQKAKARAGEIQAALGIAYGRDHYFFGKMMQYLTIKEDEVFRIYHEEFNKSDLTNSQDLGRYVFIRIKASGLSPENNFDENLSILAKTYEMSPDACRDFFQSQNIDLVELFSGVDDGMKNVSQSLAECLEKHWFDVWLRKSHYQELSEMLEPSVLNDMIDMMQALYKKLGITERIAKVIRNYVDKFGANFDEIQEMIADMSAEIVNSFVLSVGYDFFSTDTIDALKQANETQKLGLQFDLDQTNYQATEVENIASLFETMDKLGELLNSRTLDADLLKFAPGYIRRILWSEQIKIGFIQTQDIPNYDVYANKQLGEIKGLCESIHYQN